MIDSKHLKLIVAIEKYGSLNKASKELNLTQSALSHQLKNLEEYLGIDLFNRIGNQLYFTAAGKELKERASVILEHYDNLESKIQEFKESQIDRYIHGYSQREAQRLRDQATSVSEYLHFDSIWEPGSRVLEIGCGVGAQTRIIAKKNPKVQFTAIDISQKSLDLAQKSIDEEPLTNVDFRLQDVRSLRKHQGDQFDHAFICFFLEHISNPLEILKQVKEIVKKGGTITVIEGDHGSTFFHPEDAQARALVEAQVKLQEKRGGNANIGRALFPLLDKAGYQEIAVSPRQIYVDRSKPKLVDGFIRNTFTAMIQGMSEDLLQEGLVSRAAYQRGIDGLLRTAVSDGVFSYTFFKGTGVN
ncbi:MAG: methyltransferase domain-containing protein [Saprospiraceae bacterium]|nr:methyltransferase domain-containing protein [Saprospiraceae bacterium]